MVNRLRQTQSKTDPAESIATLNQKICCLADRSPLEPTHENLKQDLDRLSNPQLQQI